MNERTIIVGFTGSRRGMNARQLDALERRLISLRGSTPIDVAKPEFHHGDCVGADAQAHEIAKRLGYETHVHPCAIEKARARCDGDVTYPVYEPLERNRHIVDAVGMMLAAPDGPEKLRSGTWSTIRYARRARKVLLILTPEDERK